MLKSMPHVMTGATFLAQLKNCHDDWWTQVATTSNHFSKLERNYFFFLNNSI